MAAVFADTTKIHVHLFDASAQRHGPVVLPLCVLVHPLLGNLLPLNYFFPLSLWTDLAMEKHRFAAELPLAPFLNRLLAASLRHDVGPAVLLFMIYTRPPWLNALREKNKIFVFRLIRAVASRYVSQR